MRRVLVFAKLPAPGRVKTRLAATAGLSLESAAILARGMLLDTLLLARSYPLTFAFSPTGDRAVARKLVADSGAPPGRVSLVPQAGHSFGDRLQNAIDAARTVPCDLAIVGGDSPHLGSGGIAQVFALLRTHRLVSGPSARHGMYVIGLRRDTHFDVRPAFDTPPSAGNGAMDGELPTLLALAESLGIPHALLPRGFDVDDVEDLEKLELWAANRQNHGLTFTRSALSVIRSEPGSARRRARHQAAPPWAARARVEGSSP